MSQDNWTPIYSICPDTGLRICEIYQFLLVREDGKIKNINPQGRRAIRKWNQGILAFKGYLQVRIPFLDCKKFVHRVIARAFLEDYTECLQVDHINGLIKDNSVQNLRMVTNRQNSQNKKCHREGHLVGTRYHKKDKKWHSRIRINGKRIVLGYFGTEQEAHNAYMQALKEIQKEMPLA